MSSNKEKAKIAKIRKYIEKSGFPTEIQVGNILRKKGWLVINQSPYTDKATEKIRTIDVSAFKLGLKPPIMGFQLIIECKKSTQHEWVFHTQPKEQEFLPAMLTIIEFLKRIAQPPFLSKLKGIANDINLKQLFGLESANLKKLNELSRLHILDRSVKLGVFHLVPSKNDDFFEATQQIVSAIKSHKDNKNTFVLFPIIVFDGDIFEFYEAEGDMKIFPVNHIQVVSYNEGELPCMIDVVRKTYLPEFLAIIESDFKIYEEILSQ